MLIAYCLLLIANCLVISAMRTILLCLLSIAGFSQTNYDVIIRNGKIIDGTGNSWFYGDIGVKDGKIISVGKLNSTATKIIDATGLIIAPGIYRCTWTY